MIVAISMDTFCETASANIHLKDGAWEFFNLAAERHIKLLVLVDTGTSKGKHAARALKFWKSHLLAAIPTSVKRIEVIGYHTGELASRLRGNNIYLCVVGKRSDIDQVRGMTRTLIYDGDDNRIPELEGYERAYNMWGVTETVRSMFSKVDKQNIQRKRMKRQQRKARGAGP